MDNNIVFILQSYYSDASEGGEIDHEINGVFSSEEGAKKMGEWLINQEESNGRKYYKYEINDFFVL